MAKAKKIENPCFRPCVDLYFEFCKDKLGMPAKFDAGDGSHLKQIINWLRSAIEMAPGRTEPVQDEEIIGSWRTILNRYDHWGFDKGKSIRIKQINSRLTNIVQSIKEASTGTKGMSIDEMKELNDITG